MNRTSGLLLPLLCLFWIGCGDGTTDPSHLHESAVRLVHAAYGSPPLGLMIDSAAVGKAISYGAFQEEYARIESGNRSVEVRPNTGMPLLIGRSFDFIPGERYTIFVVADTAGGTDILIYRDNLLAPPAGKAGIRIANLIPDSPPVRLAFSGSGLGPIFNDVKFMDNTETFKPVDTAEVTLRVIDAAFSAGGGGGGNGSGSNNGGGGQTRHAILKDKTASLLNGQLYTAALIGELRDSSATLLLIRQEPQETLIANPGG